MAGVLATAGCQAPASPPAGAEPSPTVSAPASTPASTPQAEPSVETTPTQLPLPEGDPAWVAVDNPDGSKPIDTRGHPMYAVGLTPDPDNPGDTQLQPREYGSVAWFGRDGWEGQKPGHPGPAVIAAHVTRPGGGGGVPDLFYDLSRTQVGGVVTVGYDSGDEVSFLVTRSEAVDKEVAGDLSTEIGQSIWRPPGAQSVIRLFTCNTESVWDGAHYLGNWVVWAERLS